MNSKWFSAVATGVLIIIQAVSLISYVNNTNYSLVKFLDALKNEDFSVYFSPSKKGDSFVKVYDDFNLIIKLFKRNKIEKEAQFKYFQYILEHVSLGIISIKKEDLYATHSDVEMLFLNKPQVIFFGNRNISTGTDWQIMYRGLFLKLKKSQAVEKLWLILEMKLKENNCPLRSLKYNFLTSPI